MEDVTMKEIPTEKLLESLMRESIKIDYSKRHEKFIVNQDGLKKMIANAKNSSGKPFDRTSQRRMFVTLMVFIKTMNDIGLNNWIPDRIKPVATKLFTAGVLDNETFMKEIGQ